MTDGSKPTIEPEHTPEELAQAREDAELLSGYKDLVESEMQAETERREDSRDAGDKDAVALSSERLKSLLTLLAWVVAALILLGAAYALWGPDDDSTADPDSDTPAAAQAAESGEVSSPQELAAQDPIPLDERPWLFFRDDSEAAGLYTIEFHDDGSIASRHDEHFQSGTWVENGDSVEVTIYRAGDMDAESSEGDVRIEYVEWTEWFHMTRTGNTMRGSWESEHWRVSYDEGLTFTGQGTNWDTIYARP